MRVLLASFVLFSACSPEPTELPGGDPVITETGPPPEPELGVQVKVIGEPLAPGEEIEMCQYIKAGNDEAAMIERIELAANTGLHHSIVSKTATKHKKEKVPCFGFPVESMSSFDVPVPIFASSTQVSTEELALPEGVGIALDKRQQLIVNYHYVNTTNEEIIPEVWVNLHFAEEGAVEQEAGFYAFGNIGDIAVPPGGGQTLTTTCAFPQGGQILTATPHMHEMGRRFVLERHDGDGVVDTLVDTEGWFNPETTKFDPPLTLMAGEGFTFTCDWENGGEGTAYFGETSDDEMCFVFGFYTPASYDLIAFENYGCQTESNVTR